MKNDLENQGWNSSRKLPPELDIHSVTDFINTLPASPPPRRWTDFLPLKTKWIMSISLIFTLVISLLCWQPATEKASLASQQVNSKEQSSIAVDNFKPMANEVAMSMDKTTAVPANLPPKRIAQNIAPTSTKTIATDSIQPKAKIDLIKQELDIVDPLIKEVISPINELATSLDTQSPLAVELNWIELVELEDTLIGVIDLSELEMDFIALSDTISPVKTGVSSPYNWASFCKEPAVYTQSLPFFNKAVIRGNVRVVIRKGKENKVTTIAAPGKEKLVNIEVRDAVLYISSPKGKDRRWSYDVQLTTTDLEELKARARTCVWLDGADALNSIKGHWCETRNFKGWVKD